MPSAYLSQLLHVYVIRTPLMCFRVTLGPLNIIFSFTSSNEQNNGADGQVFILFIIDWIAELRS